MTHPLRHKPTLSLCLLAVSLLATLLALSAARPAAADVAIGTCYVKTDASGGNNGSSWVNAYSTVLGVSSALANNNCSQIWVAAGAYLPGASRNATFQLKNGVSLYGGFAGTEASLADRDILANETFLSGNIGDNASDADNVYHVVTGSGANNTAVVDGFTVIGGYANGSAPDNRGGGLYNNNGSPTVRNVIFKDNFAVLGGGVYNENSTPELAGLLFSGNSGAGGGGLYNNVSDVNLVNATFTGNAAYNGAGIYNYYSDPTITNVTLNENAATDYGGGLYDNNSAPIIANAILWANTAGVGGAQIFEGTGAAADVTFSVVEGGFASGSNIITADPRLLALGSHGGRMPVIPLNYDSSAIDVADGSACPFSDQRGFSRSGQGTGCDIGAYEYQPVLFASTSGRSDGFCHSWSFACDFNYALSSANFGQEIWVRYGVYKPTRLANRGASFNLPPGVRVYGGFAGTETALDQRDLANHTSILSGDIGNRGDARDNSYHVVSMNGSFIGLPTVLDGFQISYGNANGSDANAYGGGMRLASGNPTLRNLVFSDNQASYGGGIAAVGASSPTLIGVSFNTNSATQGGGMHLVAGSGEMNGVDFVQNHADQGGGLFADDSSLQMRDVTFTQNKADVQGGGIYLVDHSGGTLTDVRFLANTAASDGGGLFAFFGNDLTLYRTDFTENEAVRGGGLIDIDNTLQLIDVSFRYNRGSEDGGGLHVLTSNPALSSVDFHANSADFGGGMFVASGSPSLSDVSFTQNEAFSDGGGLFNESSSPLTLRETRFIRNTAGRDGGGLANLDNSQASVELSLFKLNDAARHGGGIFNSYSSCNVVNTTFASNYANEGAGLYNSYSDNLRINHATFSGNVAAAEGGGLLIFHSETQETRNSIFWGNSAADQGAQIRNMPAFSGWGNQALRNSIIQDGCPPEMSCTNVQASDPLLGPLSYHGGKSEVFALTDGSPAIEAAEFLGCPSTDQRGIKRPQGDFCDIGAFETRFYKLSVSKTGSGSGAVNGPDIWCGPTCESGYAENTRLTLTADAAEGSVFTGWSGNCSGSGTCTVLMSMARNVTANFDPVPAGSYALTVNVAGQGGGTVTGDGVTCHASNGADCTQVYSAGTQVTLTANPAFAANFMGWSGACDNTIGPCIVTMDQARSVTATFTPARTRVFVPLVAK